MNLKNSDLIKLADLDKLRSAPKMNKEQSKKLFDEAEQIINKADWITIGVMSPSLQKAINTVREIEEKFKYKKMKCISLPTSNGPIYLKANQKTGEIHARIEYGLGEGVLISCQNHDDSMFTKTIGPFPLDFFN